MKLKFRQTFNQWIVWKLFSKIREKTNCSQSNDNTLDTQLGNEQNERILNENVFNSLDIKSQMIKNLFNIF